MQRADRPDDLRTVWSDATDALRARSPELLRRALFDAARAGGGGDPRDLMVTMAPLHHCARQLGQDPAALFADVAADLRGQTAELVQEFGARTDITESTFRFVLDEADDGPFYRPMTAEEDAAATERFLKRFLRRHPVWRMRHRRARND